MVEDRLSQKSLSERETPNEHQRERSIDRAELEGDRAARQRNTTESEEERYGLLLDCCPDILLRESGGGTSILLARSLFAGRDQCEGRFRALVLQKLHISRREQSCTFAKADISGKKAGRGRPREAGHSLRLHIGGAAQGRRRPGKFMAKTRAVTANKRRCYLMHERRHGTGRDPKGTSGRRKKCAVLHFSGPQQEYDQATQL